MKEISHLLIFISSVVSSLSAVEVIWDSPQKISISDNYDGNPVTAIDARGNAVAVFTAIENTNYLTRASTFIRKSKSWTSAVTLSSAPNAISPQVSTNAAGFTMAIWSDSEKIWASHSNLAEPPANLWSSETSLSPLGEFGSLPQVGITSNGKTVAIWVSSVSSPFSFIRGAIYSPKKNSWSSSLILSATDSVTGAPQLAVNESGEGVAVWLIKKNGFNVVQAARYRASKDKWTNPFTLSEEGQNAFTPQVAIDPSGNAVVVWRRSNGTHLIIQSSSFDAQSKKWTQPVNLSNKNYSSNQPLVGINGDGESLAIWVERVGLNFVIKGVTGSTDIPGQWSKRITFSDPQFNGINPSLATSSNKNGVLLYQLDRGIQENDLISSEIYSFKKGLITDRKILTQKESNATTPNVKMNAKGKILAIWKEASSSQNFIVARTGKLKPRGTINPPSSQSNPSRFPCRS